jgi:hypothetical protein
VIGCPACGTSAEPGQLVCINCGWRLALRDSARYAGPPRNAIPVIALLLAVVVIGAGAFGFALSEITSDDGGGSGNDQAAASTPPAPTAGGGGSQAGGSGDPGTDTSAAGEPQHKSRSVLLEWPPGVTAYTVVLVTSSDKPAAHRVALEASKSGIEAGMLDSDEYDLGTGLWIVYAGRFDSQSGAAKQASNLAGRYPGAYVQRVRPQS